MTSDAAAHYPSNLIAKTEQKAHALAKCGDVTDMTGRKVEIFKLYIIRVNGNCM